MTLTGSNELVTTIVLVDNPNDDKTCHNLDIEMIEVVSLTCVLFY